MERWRLIQVRRICWTRNWFIFLLIIFGLIIPNRDADAASGRGRFRQQRHRRIEHVLVTGGFGPVNSESEHEVSDTAEVYDVKSGSFSATNNTMSDPREFHTATRLHNGKVLVAGGFNSAFQGLSSADLYDPKTDEFMSTGDMTVARVGHTATLLRNGTVLMAGGNSFIGGVFNPIASAEIYDPGDGTFTPTGDMNGARQGHTATRLRNGLVLIAGGGDATDNLATAELYDPSSHTFAATGSMTTARAGHTANRLGNGKVLMTGGADQTQVLATAELYDPSAGTFSATGGMGTPREFHTSARLPDGKVLILGGTNRHQILSSAQLYDPETGLFTCTGSMHVARRDAIAKLLANGKNLVTGGSNALTPAIGEAELYDPSSGTFSATGSMVEPRDNATITGLVSDGDNGRSGPRH